MSLINWKRLKYALVVVACLAYWVNGPLQRNTEEMFQCCLALTSADISYSSNETWWYDSQGVSVPMLRHPIAVAYATSTRQVSSLVRCALQYNVKPVPRSGGHSVEAFSSQDGKLVIDISRINFIRVHPHQLYADVGAGIRLGKLYYEISMHRLGFPAGTCPSVGLGGQVAVGGYGHLTRIWGLAADNILSIEFVDWQGNVILTNGTEHSDLFFALRAGGAGSYGIVTEMKLKLHPFPKVSTAFSLSWEQFPATVDFIKTWFKWKPWLMMPPEMKIIALVGGNMINGLYVGEDGAEGVAEIMNKSGLMTIGLQPVILNFTSTNLLLAQTWLLNSNKHYGNETDYQILNTGPHALESLNLPPYPVPVHPTWRPLQDDSRVNNTQLTSQGAKGPISELKLSLTARDYYKYTSQMITKEFNEFLSEELDEFIGHGGISLWEPHGGVLDSEPEIPNAFAHRKALFNVQHFVPYKMSLNGDKVDGISHQNKVCHKLTAAMEPYTNHTSYQGYPDLLWTTDPKTYMARYYGPHVDKLIAVKNNYDPHDCFSNPQSTPLQL